VPVKDGMYARVTYVIGADGAIARVFPRVNPSGHADEVLAVLRSLPR
jgi:peroxiredoxin